MKLTLPLSKTKLSNLILKQSSFWSLKLSKRAMFALLKRKRRLGLIIQSAVANSIYQTWFSQRKISQSNQKCRPKVKMLVALSNLCQSAIKSHPKVNWSQNQPKVTLERVWKSTEQSDKWKKLKHHLSALRSKKTKR